MTQHYSVAAPLLEVESATKSFPGVKALEDVCLRVDPGEVLALVGENGAGKSTLIKILSGALRPDGGAIRVDGKPVTIGSPADALELGIATVYQEFSLFPDLTVAENLFFNAPGAKRTMINWRKQRDRAGELLTRLGVHVDPTRTVSDLTIAEQQMIEIAKAVSRNARVLILDEPTAVLGGADVDALLALMRSLRERGAGLIFVSHKLDEIFDIADRYVVLRDGSVTGSGDVAQTNTVELVQMLVGRELEANGRPPATEPGDVVLEVRGLRRRGVFQDINLSVRAGEVVGLAGLRGSGRTEVARAIFGVDRADSGTVRVKGETLTLGRPRAAIETGIAFVSEDRKAEGLLLELSVMHNITLVNVATGAMKWLTASREMKVATHKIKDLRIKVSDPNVAVGTLSGGNQQKVVIAKWLESNPSVMIMDEPTRGIDVGAKEEIYRLIAGLCEAGVAVLLISSELPEVIRLSDRVIVMQQGRMVAEVSSEEATQERIGHYMVDEVAR